MNQEKIGKFIYDLRKKYNLTQAELASRLHVTAQAVSKWENGRGVPDIELLKKLSEEFDVSITELIEGEKKKNKLVLIISIIFLILVIVILIIVNIFINNDESFTFSSLTCDNDSFSISGVIAYNDSKKAVYISNIDYCDDEKIEPKAITVECILYEIVNGEEKEIAKYESLNESNKSDYISTFLEKIEFNIDDYNCGCDTDTCNNLHIRIRAKDMDDKIVTYEIPLVINKTCSD